MDSTVYLTGSRMNGLAEELQVISANLANANTTGFKGTAGKFRSVLTAVGSQGVAGAGMSPSWPQFGGLRTDFSQGPIRTTERGLDLAIRGRGFFVVDTPAGPRYTRKGRLHVNARGEVTDGAGNPFRSDSGVLRLPEAARHVTVAPNGEVLAEGQSVGRLTLQEIPQVSALVAEGSCNYRNDGPAAVPAAGSEIVQGAIEESNVNAVREMVALIIVMRSYEASAHIIKRTDALNGELIKTA